MWILLGLLILILVVFTLVLLLNVLVNDRKISTHSEAWNLEEKHNVLAVFAHPDDEVMVAGTLATLKNCGSNVHLLYLTHGEDGPTGNLVKQEHLGEFRKNELTNVSKILNADTIKIENFPDRYLNTIDENIIKETIKKEVVKYSIDTLISFDKHMGLYGNLDHAHAGKCTISLFESEPSIKNLLIMTLPTPMLNIALLTSKTFKANYDQEIGLPHATYGIKIKKYAKEKMNVVKAHKSQWQVMNDVQPLYSKMPSNIYYRIFSREYFHLLTKK